MGRREECLPKNECVQRIRNESDIGYPTPGSFGNYIEAKGIAMVTLEMPVADTAACWTHNRSRSARGNSPSLGSVHPQSSMENDPVDFQEDEPESEVRHDLSVGITAKPLPPGTILPRVANS